MDLLSWRIERILLSSLDLYRRHSTDGTKCNAKIAKYHHCRIKRSLLWEITRSLAAAGNDLRVRN